MKHRVVITGIGVVAPNGIGAKNFNKALKRGTCAIQYWPEFAEYGFGCHLHGAPQITEQQISDFTKKYNMVKMRSSAIIYGCMAGVEAWLDAGLEISDRRMGAPDWDSGCIFGTSCAGVEAFDVIYENTRIGESRKMGGRIAQQAMNSGVSAYLGGILGLGNQVTTYSSESNTGLESIINGFHRIQWGLSKRMLTGSTDSNSPFIFGGYDSVIADDGNYSSLQERGAFKDHPEDAMRPMGLNSRGSIAGSGSGALMLESLESAKERGAFIYGEIIGTNINSGAQREDGKLFTPYKKAGILCIKNAIKEAKIKANSIDLISTNGLGHYADEMELEIMLEALKVTTTDLPYFNTTKSLIGHCLSSAGTIETVALLLELKDQYIHRSSYQKPLIPIIGKEIPLENFPNKTLRNIPLNIVAKYSYGFGDVNSCLIMKKWEA